MTVTPAVARMWLAGTNQWIQQDKVREYATAMAAGRWCEQPGHERVTFLDGRLRNGHHRLHAVILSGATVELEPYGDPPEVS